MRMRIPRRFLQASLLTAVVLVSLSVVGCGASDESLTHIKGTSAIITKPMLDHWMRSLASGDFRQNLASIAPQGLVAEPANYPECVKAAKTIVPKTTDGLPQLSDGQLTQKCHELYNAVKTQALGFLITVEWTVAEAAEMGITVSSAAVRRGFERYRHEAFHSDAEFHKYISERGWTPADMLYRYKLEMLVHKLLPRFEAKVKQAGGGEQIYAKLALERYRKRIGRTSCHPGYVVPQCREYHETASPAPSPREVLKAFVVGQA
jgi:hypothetical protein